MQIDVKLGIGDAVYIDDDRSMKAYVTAFCWRSESEITVECSWIHNGSSQSSWIQMWRLYLVQA